MERSASEPAVAFHGVEEDPGQAVAPHFPFDEELLGPGLAGVESHAAIGRAGEHHDRQLGGGICAFHRHREPGHRRVMQRLGNEDGVGSAVFDEQHGDLASRPREGRECVIDRGADAAGGGGIGSHVPCILPVQHPVPPGWCGVTTDGAAAAGSLPGR